VLRACIVVVVIIIARLRKHLFFLAFSRLFLSSFVFFFCRYFRKTSQRLLLTFVIMVLMAKYIRQFCDLLLQRYGMRVHLRNIIQERSEQLSRYSVKSYLSVFLAAFHERTLENYSSHFYGFCLLSCKLGIVFVNTGKR